MTCATTSLTSTTSGDRSAVTSTGETLFRYPDVLVAAIAVRQPRRRRRADDDIGNISTDIDKLDVILRSWMPYCHTHVTLKTVRTLTMAAVSTSRD